MPALSSTPPIRLALAAALLLTACDDTPTEPTVLLPTADAMLDASPDAMDTELDAGADTVADMASDNIPDGMRDDLNDGMPDGGATCTDDCAVITWTEGPSLPRVSDHHTTAVFGDDIGAALFVLGGIETDAQGGIAAMSDEILRSRLADDGALTPFAVHGRLPFALAFHGQAIGPNHMHLVGGVRMGLGGPAGSAAVVALPHGPGDVLGEAVLCEAALPQGVVHPTAERVGDRLYVIGGTRQAPVDGVAVAEIGPDGCPLPFAAATPLPEPRSHHASAVIGGRIVVMGGFGQGQQPRTDVLASTHGPDGVVDGWEVVGQLDPAPWTAAAVVDGDWIWLIGGGEGQGFAADFVDTVRRAPLVDGLPGAFETVDMPLLIARSHVHQTPLYDGRIYSVGGRIFQDDGFSMTSTDRTFVGALLDDR